MKAVGQVNPGIFNYLNRQPHASPTPPCCDGDLENYCKGVNTKSKAREIEYGALLEVIQKALASNPREETLNNLQGN